MLSRVTNSFVEHLNKLFGLTPKLSRMLFSHYAQLVVDWKDIYRSETFCINVSASAEILPAVAGKRWVVDDICLVAAGTVTVRLDSGTTAISGLIPLVANSGFVASNIWCVVGERFYLTLGGAVDVDGFCTARLIDFE